MKKSFFALAMMALALTLKADEANKEEYRLGFNNAPIASVLQAYGKDAKKTILPDPGLPNDKKITLESNEGQILTREEYLEAIEVVLVMNGVYLEPYGDKFLRALPREKVRKEGIKMIIDPDGRLKESGKIVSVMISFTNIAIDEAKTALSGFTETSRMIDFERINSILVTDTEQNVKRMLEIAAEIDKATPVLEQTFVEQIQHASVADIKTALDQIVEDSRKDQEKMNKNSANVRQNNTPQPVSGRPIRPGSTPQVSKPDPVSVGLSDADRGLIRGKVLIIADERSNKLIIITRPSNMDFFKSVIKSLDVETTPDTVVKVFRLKFADAEEVSDMVNDLIGATVGKSSTRENTNKNSRNGTSGKISSGSATAQNANRSANQRTGEAKAGELTKDNTTVLADKRINGIVVMTLKELLPTVERIISEMDVKLSQVLIETAIIEVTLGDDLSTGVDWVKRGTDDNMINNGKVIPGEYMLGGGGGTGSSLLKGIMGVTNLTASAGALWGGANPINSGVNYFLKSDKLNISAVIQATKSDSHAKYLASPIVMTVDNKEATIEATESRKFFNGYETSNSYSSYMRTPKYDSKDIGITIKVTPKINPNGTVMLNVEEEYSQLGAGQSILVDDGSTANIDTALTRKMSADILLDNHQTVVLGGLTEKYVSEKETGIPILKDIPWIGKWLFGSVTQSETRKELLVFMTPYVLDDAASAQLEALRRKKALSDPRPWEDLGWSDSELADPIAQKELIRRIKEEWKRRDQDRQNALALESEKVKRAEELKKMSEADLRFWLDMHKDELKNKEEQKNYDRTLRDMSPEERQREAEQIRERKLKEAEGTIQSDPATPENQLSPDPEPVATPDAEPVAEPAPEATPEPVAEPAESAPANEEASEQ